MWRLYYADGSHHTGETLAEWQPAPARGVQGLLTPSERVGRFIETGDFYIWPRWQPVPIAADAWGLMDYLLEAGFLEPDQPMSSLSFETLVEAGVKLGRSLPDTQWQTLHCKMVEDPDFPRKSAHERRER